MKSFHKAPRVLPPRPPSRRGSVRIIGGKWKRRGIPVLDAAGLRPTPDRVRETLFNWLTHAFGGSLAGVSALDLFAGSGALGFEAASRGADPVVLVESNPAVAERLCSVREEFGAALQLDVRTGDALIVGARLKEARRCFDIVFLDPPFGQDWLDNALPLALGLCRPTGCIYVETEKPLPDEPLAAAGLEVFRSDRAGEVFYHLLRRNKND